MPIFEYECTECGERTEHLQLSSDSPLVECPQCGGVLRKLLSVPAFQFKGSGWYVTDYAGKGKDPAEKPPSSGNGTGESSGTSTPGGDSAKASDSSDSGKKASKAPETKTSLASD